MNKEDALNILKAYAICNVQDGDLTCSDCPFMGDLILKFGRHRLPCEVNQNLTNEKVVNAVKTLRIP